MIAMVLVFAVVYSITISRVGFEYKDTILIPKEENRSTIYSGRIRIFDSSFFALVQETLYLSHFRLIFLSNLCLLYCVLYRTVL